MDQKQLGVAVIGCGARGCCVVEHLLKASRGGVRVVSVYDPDQEEVKRALEIWNMPETKNCSDYQEAIRTPGVEWVMVFSPNAYHAEQVIDAFKAGKDVFAEKPLATSLEDCQRIYDAYVESQRRFATGFVLRYAPIYRKVRELLDSGEFGDILCLSANENIAPEHGGYIMCNWRRHTSLAGPHILEKCCHDLDLINWFVGSLPEKVMAFGGRDFFKPENAGLMDEFGKKTFVSWRDPHGIDSPFTDDTDLIDTQVAVARFRNNVKVSFVATMSNAIPERRMYFSCRKGNIKLDLYSGKLVYRKLGDVGYTTLDFPGDGHGGGDGVMMKEFYEAMRNGGKLKSGGNEGLESAVFAMAIDKAMREENVVDLCEIWKKLDR